jgi:hypothetical protein
MENRYQVIGETGRKRTMKITIALYLSNPAEDKILYKNLIQAGIRVCKIGDISRLHTILKSQLFDCILVNGSFLKLHELSPARHLWNARSPHTILEWTRDENNVISTKTHIISAEISGINRSFDYYDKITYINDVLSGINRENSLLEQQKTGKKENQPDFPVKTIEIPEEVHLHKKIRLILDCLINSGDTGMDCETIIEKIWGTTEQKRRKDVQIYICKLRGILALTTNHTCQISYFNKRYYLLNTEVKKYR